MILTVYEKYKYQFYNSGFKWMVWQNIVSLVFGLPIELDIAIQIQMSTNQNVILTFLIVGFCILLRVYPLMLFLKTTVRNNGFFLRTMVLRKSVSGHIDM
jgi:hypothetical protein